MQCHFVCGGNGYQATAPRDSRYCCCCKRYGIDIIRTFDHLLKPFAFVCVQIGVLVRNEPLLLFLYWAAKFVTWQRYRINRMVQCIGGLHVSCNTSSFVWIVTYVVVDLRQFAHSGDARFLTGLALPVLMLCMIASAVAPARHRKHNLFEAVHRYVFIIVAFQVSVNYPL